MNDKIVVLEMDYGRTITGILVEPMSEDYYHIRVVKIDNPIPNGGDWRENEQVKISKSIVKHFKFK